MKIDLEELFHRVADLSPEARAQYFTDACIDEETRREIETLLSFDSGPNACPHENISIAASQLLPQFEAGHGLCGPYRLQKVIGWGGMGVVYLAERADGEVTQQVAVKLLPMGAGEAHRTRFLQERQILAGLTHPNIARMMDAGHLESGQPYLAMEYVAGRPIDEFAAGLPIRRKIELFLKVCSAAAYLHRNLIVHRDLKPGNILVTPEGEPKLLDFGIAKLLDLSTDSTITSMRMMTPGFASPEQVAGKGLTTATDVYSLGAVLYQMLTDKPAHEFDTAAPQAIATAFEREVTRPSSWVPELKGDLDIILLKALRKEPQERYGTVEQLAEDLLRYLRAEPIRARPDALLYRMRKFVLRHWAGMAAAVVALLALLAGTGIAVWQARKSAQQRDLALTNLRRAEATDEFSSSLLTHATPSAGKPISNAELLTRGEALIDKRYAGDLELCVHLLLTLADRYFENQQFADRARVLRKAYTESRPLADFGLRSYAACEWASQLAERGDFQQAKKLLDEVLPALSAQPENAAFESRCRVLESNVADHMFDGAHAVRAAERAVAIEERRGGDRVWKRRALGALAWAYGRAYRYPEMDRTFERAGKLLEAEGGENTREMVTLLNNWSAMLQNAGQMLRAAELADRLLRIARAVDSEHGASLSNLITAGNALMVVGRFEEADQLFEESVRKARAAGSTPRLIMAFSFAVDSACEAGDPKRGARLMEEARAVLKNDASASVYSKAIVDLMAVKVALENEDGERAIVLSTRARDALEKATPTKTSLPRALGLLGRGYMATGRFREALTIAEDTVRSVTAHPTGFPFSYLVGNALLRKATALEGLGEVAAARKTAAAAFQHAMATAGPRCHTTQRAEALLRQLGRE